MELYKHQQEIVDENRPRLGLFHAPGLGKTITLLELTKKNNVEALIICPKGIKKQWQDYVTSYNANHLVVTKEEFRRDHKKLPKYKAVIVDEAHHFSNLKSGLAKALMWYFRAHEVKYRWLATGTPYRSSPMNIYALGRLLGHLWDYWSFFNEFFYMVQMGHRQIPQPRPHMEEELEGYVRQIGVTLALDAVMNVPPQHNQVIIVERTDEQNQAITDLTEVVAISRFTQIHCIEQGFKYGDEYVKDEIFESEKNKVLINLCIKWKRIAIVCRYTKQIESIKEQLQTQFPKRMIFIISGATKDRHYIVEQINKSKDCIVLIQAQCSEGYELPKIQAMVFASLSWSHVDHVQMKARISRMNALKENNYYYLITKGIDQHVYKTIMNHQDFHEKLYSV